MKTQEKPTNPEMNVILEQLKKPFHPAQVVWKPGMLNQERTRALALAYADLRAYQNRLDEVCGLDWSVTYTPWGDRIVCHLTIQGITRSSTGEPDSQSERSEIAGTAAEAQAFKRACAMFGLGRYLYNLPTVWVEYDGNQRAFSERAKARLDLIIHQHYRRTMGEDAASEGALNESTPTEAAPAEAAPASVEPAEAQPAESVAIINDEQPSADVTTEPEPTVENTSATTQSAPEEAAAETTTPPTPTNGHNGHATSRPPVFRAIDALRQQFSELGSELYGDQWEQVCRHNVERITNGQSSDSAQLTAEQLQKLVTGLKRPKAQTQPWAEWPAGLGARSRVGTDGSTAAGLAVVDASCRQDRTTRIAMWIEQEHGGRNGAAPSATHQLHTETMELTEMRAKAICDAQQEHDPALRQEALTWLWICCPDLATELNLPTPSSPEPQPAQRRQREAVAVR